MLRNHILTMPDSVDFSVTPTPESSVVASPINPLIETDHLGFAYGKVQVLDDISLSLPAEGVTAFIGPSGCGKSTLLRCFNRMNDLIEGANRTSGSIRIQGVDIYQPRIDLGDLRRRVGMVFQHPNPFASSVYENIAFGLRLLGLHNKSDLDERVAVSLERAALWDEVKDRLNESGKSLSLGQQQRLCIARAIAVHPQILLMDEPCIGLDPVATAQIEELIHRLKKNFKIVVVTHNLQQAARVSDQTAFFYQGKLIEFNDTEQVFLYPSNRQTEAYVSGRFG